MKQLLCALCALLFVLPASAAVQTKGAHPQPQRIAWMGRVHVITRPDLQLWSQSEIARTGWPMVNGWHVAQRLARGSVGDRTNRNWLVVRVRDGKMLKPEAKWMVRPDPWAPAVKGGKGEKVKGGWWARALAPFRPLPSAPLRSAPLTITLAWDDVSGAIPAGWGAPDLIMMPDGGPKFWTVHASRDLRTWRTVAVVTTNRVTIGTPWPGEFYTVHWRGQGTPAEVWP